MNAAGALWQFRVQGVEEGRRSYVKPFDETYEIEGEHPAEALEKLIRSEIEWGILDTDHGFTIEFVPPDDNDDG